MITVSRHRPHLHAPALQFPLRRSAWLVWILASLCALQLALLLWWALGDSSSVATLKLAVSISTWLLTTASAAHWWWHSCRGSIHWDGLMWNWQQPSGDSLLLQALQVRLDFQSHLLVQVRCFDSPRSIHLWLERRADPLHWLALRRAVYSRAVGELSAR